MVNYTANFTADLENVAKITWDKDTAWVLDVQELGGGEERSGVEVRATKFQPVPNSRAEANFYLKWKGSRTIGRINVCPLPSNGIASYGIAETGVEKPIVQFEARGVEIVGVRAYFGQATSTAQPKGTVFTCETTGECWADFDEPGNQPVSIDHPRWSVTT